MRWFILAGLLFLLPAANAQELSVVSSYYQLAKQDAIDIFMFREFMFPDGTKVKMVVLPRDSYTTRNFSRQLGMTSIRFHEKAEAAFGAGKLNMLVIAENDKEVIKQVIKQEGAIGYVQDYSIFSTTNIPSVIRIR